MSLFGALSTSLSGLQSVSTQMQLVADNIANAGQAGFTKKSAIVAARVLGSSGGGTIISGFTRAENDALTISLNKASSDAGLRSAQNTYLQQVQSILGSNSGDNPPLTESITQMQSAWAQLAAAPESNVQQQQVIQAATNLAAQVRRTSEAVESLDRQSLTDVNDTLDELNSNLADIAALNNQITQALSVGQSAGNLQDQRDLLVQKIASVVEVTVLPREQGKIALFTPAGYMLLDGKAQTFSYDGTNVTSSLNPTMSLNNILAGGKLQAVVGFRATTTPPSTDPATSVIQKLRSQLDTVANAFTESSVGPPQTFANAYDQTASVSVASDSINFKSKYSGTFGNGITVTLGAGAILGTYKATVHVAGQPDEIYDNVDASGGNAAFWDNLATAINAGSRLITAQTGSGAANPAAGGPYALVGGSGNSINGTGAVTIPGDGMTFSALASGTDGNGISVNISDGTNSTALAPSFKVTITCPGKASETFDNIDATGGGAAFWANVATAVNFGQGPLRGPSQLVMATAGTTTTAPTRGVSRSYPLTGGTNELQSDFFTGTDRSTFAVNAALVDGSRTIKLSAPVAVGATFNDSTKTFTADGLHVTRASYSSLGTSIVSVFQQAASSISQLNTTAANQKDYLQQRLTNDTGVNVDTETASLVTLQNAYAASAHVIAVLQQMFSVLTSIGTG